MWREGPDGGPIGDPPSGSSDPLVVDLAFTNPPSQVNGPWNGVTVVVDGTAGIVSGSGSIDRVEVRFGTGASYAAATSTGAGWKSWTASSPVIAVSGAIEVAARVIVDGEPLKERTITVTTVLEPKPSGDPQPQPDTTPPSVAITAPAATPAIVAAGGAPATIQIAGTATDTGSGIDRVEVEVDGVSVTPSTPDGTWANWTASGVLPGLGLHGVTARAFDKAGNSSTATVKLSTVATPPTPPVVERLFVVERCRLTSFLGAYGAGKTIKTLTLLPGEKTTINVKTYRRDSDTENQTSSILDSNTDEAEQDFENTLQSEQSHKAESSESSSWKVDASASGGFFGIGSFSVDAGASGASNASREELAKNVANAVQKHAAKTSSKRDIEVKSSREMKKEEGEEYSTESTIENINVSRTLNFVFRQMNQEYVTLLHLVDVRVAYVRGDLVVQDGQESVQYTYREATLSQLDALLGAVIVPDRVDDVHAAILEVLGNVFDWQDDVHSLVEVKQLVDASGRAIPNGSYLRVPKGLTSTYADPATGSSFTVPGVILAVMKNIMRTDGIVCDAFLGQGDALDDYSKGLQREAVEARRLENDRAREALHKDKLALEIVKGGNADEAKLFGVVYPQPEHESLALVTSPFNAAGNGTGS
jgi:hypothetical protein